MNVPINAPILNYLPHSQETKHLKKKLNDYKNTFQRIKMKIGSEWVKSDTERAIQLPHKHDVTLGIYYEGDKGHVKQAIEASAWAKSSWQDISLEQRSSIFLKAAYLIATKYRQDINALTILGQSKTVFQAEIDAACELIDFLNFNVYFLEQIYKYQPISSEGILNRLEYRPLEGFIYAITPFNFTSIAANLALTPVLMGNTVIWKPSDKQIYSAWLIMDIMKEAGLPDGVINLIYTPPKLANEVIFNHSDFAGLHFTGSTKVFKALWKEIGIKINTFKNYPRIVGETGGKDFIVAHASANPDALSTAIIRGSFEYQGQKCSAASRAYIPKNLWKKVKSQLLEQVPTIKMGDPEDFTNFMGAVIGKDAFDRIVGYIEQTKKSSVAKILVGGGYDKSEGYFIQPTIIQSFDNQYITLYEEIFGPVITIYVYETEKFEETLTLIDKTSQYGLTGSIFAQDAHIIEKASKKLRYAAGNFYINDKPTGAVVGQQPFGGSRASGTNDKAGSMYNLLRWTSPRTIKENFNPPTEYPYPHMK